MGTISGSVPPETGQREEWLFWDEDEHLLTEFERAEFDFILTGMCFDFSVIEMLLPGQSLPESEMPLRGNSERKGLVGRPAKWDWASVLEHLIGKAQTPDGLPSGPGAQAEIERMIADWFMETEGGCPSESQIRHRAQRVMNTVKNRPT